MRRRTRLLVAAPLVSLAALAAASACAPYHAGAAATVGDDRISTDQLRTLTQKVIGEQPAPANTSDTFQTTVQQTALGELIALQVLGEMAGPLKVSVTPAEVGASRLQIAANIDAASGASASTPAAVQTAAVSAAAHAGVDLDELAQVTAMVDAVTAAMPVTDQQLQKAYAGEGDHRYYGIKELDVTDQQTASEVAAALQSSPGSVDQVAAAAGLAAPQEQTIPATTLEQQTQGTAVKVGQVIGPLQTQSGGYAVLLVTSATTRTLADVEAPGSAERQQVAAPEFTTAYAAEAKHLGVHVSPRFGTWAITTKDITQLGIGGVAAGGPQLSSPVGASPSTTASAGS